jgi:Cysteine-rich CPXCG
MESGYACAGCGEWNETSVDESTGSRQRYVEDCQVRYLLRVSWDADSTFLIEAELE